MASSVLAGLPGNHEVSRYESIWTRSPFVAVTNAVAAEGIAGRFAVTGFARLGDADIVFLYDRKELKRFALAKEAPVHGLELLSVAEGGRPEDFKARIRSGGDSAEIQFDAALALSAEPPGEKRPANALVRQVPAGGQPSPSAVNVAGGNTAVMAGTDQSPVPRPTRVIRRRTISAQ